MNQCTNATKRDGKLSQRSESSRKKRTDHHGFKIHPPINHAATCVNSGPFFHPTIITRPAHHAQLETTFNSDTAHSKPYIIINSGQQILPDDPPFNIYNIFPAKIIQNNIFA